MSPFLGGFLSHKYGTKLVTGWSTFVTCILSSLIPFAAPISATLVAGVRVIQGILSVSGGQSCKRNHFFKKFYISGTTSLRDLNLLVKFKMKNSPLFDKIW